MLESVFSNRSADYKWNSLPDICATAKCATLNNRKFHISRELEMET